MTWLYHNMLVEQLPEDCIGFVYLITNTATDRKYVGKKLAKFAKTSYRVIKQKNGIKKKKKIRGKIDSNWREYWSSSDELKKDIALHGENNFTREILFYCKSKAECTYVEAREQFAKKVLESDDYYNGQISCRIHGSHIKGKISGIIR